jgi:hypothetical protein
MTFILHNQIPVSLLISKDEVKVRIQSPDFSALWLITKEMVKRLEEVYGEGENGIEITFPD